MTLCSMAGEINFPGFEMLDTFEISQKKKKKKKSYCQPHGETYGQFNFLLSPNFGKVTKLS